MPAWLIFLIIAVVSLSASIALVGARIHWSRRALARTLLLVPPLLVVSLWLLLTRFGTIAPAEHLWRLIGSLIIVIGVPSLIAAVPSVPAGVGIPARVSRIGVAVAGVVWVTLTAFLGFFLACQLDTRCNL